MGSKRVAVVTGANKGIGYEIVRGLCKSEFDGDVFLTARNVELGKKAVEALNTEGLHPAFHQLDIGDAESIEKLKETLQANYGGVDILINNAGIAFKGTATEPFDQQAEETMRINFWGTLNVCDAMFPLLRPHARVVHLGSLVSAWSAKKCSEELNQRFLDKDLTMDKVKQLMTEFVQASKDGNNTEKGWTGSPYGTSKIGIYLMSVVQQKEFDQDQRKDLIVNCCCPDWVKTDLTGMKGYLTPEQGADNPVYAALLKADCSGPKGQYIGKRKVWTWPGEIGSEQYLKS